MSIFALTFPLLFIFHDMEEIIGMRSFITRNAEMLQRRFPFIYRQMCHSNTESFAIGVMEELVVFILIAIAALYFDNTLCWNIWFGAFFGLAAHYVMHIGQFIVIRKYIPAIITSVICLPISVWILYRCYGLMEFNIWYALIGLALAAVNAVVAVKMAWRGEK